MMVTMLIVMIMIIRMVMITAMILMMRCLIDVSIAVLDDCSHMYCEWNLMILYTARMCM